MKPSFPPPMRNGRRKLSVEVYFVLYLTAIILLLGTAPLSEDQYDAELEEAIAQLVDTDFEVTVQKIALIVPFLPAGMQADTIDLDLARDTVNVIRAHGSFSRVSFRIVHIEDTATGQSLPVNKATLVRDDDSSALFSWNQGAETETAIYRVSVEAEASPVIPSSVTSPAVRERIAAIIRRRTVMRDTAMFTINVIPVTDYAIAARDVRLPGTDRGDQAIDSVWLRRLAEARLAAGTNGDLVLMPQDNRITSPPGSEWRQRLIVLGGDPARMDFTIPPKARIVARGENYVQIAGETPLDGEQDVWVTGHVPGGASAEISFRVITRSLDDPRGLQQTFYVGESYSLDFRSSGIDDGRISVSVFENGRETLANKGPVLSFTPSATGSVRFVRYVDDVVSGEFRASIDEYPLPVIGQPRKTGDGRSVVVRTVSYGHVDGRPNRAILRIRSGNAQQPEEQSIDVDETSGRVTMRWLIRRERSSEPFRFRMQVWDQRGFSYRTEKEYAE